MTSRAVFGLDRQRGLAALTLAVGLGAAAIGFTVLDSVLLRPLQFPQSETLYSLHHTAPGLNLPRLEQTDATYLLYRQSPVLDDLGIYRTTEVDVTGSQTPERLTAALVSPELLPMLGSTPIHGRGFVAEEEVPGGIDAVLIGAGYWQRRFGGKTEILGRALVVDGRPRTIVGVLPSSARFPSPEVDLWLPLALDPQTARGARFRFSAIARLPSVDQLEMALGDLHSRLARLAVDYPQSGWSAEMLDSSGLAPILKPLKEEMVGDVRRLIWALAAAVGLLLLTACSNVATLLLVRAEDRRPEVALRAALGADRWQLLLTQLVPAWTMGITAGAFALGLAALGLRLLTTQGPDVLTSVRQLTVDGRTVLFTLGVALVLSTILGLITGLRGFDNPARWLRSGGVTQSHERFRTALVIFQVAAAAALSAGAGTLAVSLLELSRVDPGFELSEALSFDVRLPKARYVDAASTAGFYGRALDRLRSLPGVKSVGGVHRLPLSGGGSNNGWSAEGMPRGPDEVPVVFATRWASEDYFDAMGIPLLQGRALVSADRELMQPVAVVSQAFAAHFWGDQDPLGRRVALGTGEYGPWYDVVGVVGDVRDRGLSQPLDAMVYLPLHTRLPRREAPYTPAQLSFVLRSEQPAADLGSAVRTLIAELDPELPVNHLGPLERLARDDLAASRFSLSTLLATAAITGLLGIVGLFGLMAYGVRRRRRDFGVRLALGADPGRLQRQVQARSLRLTATGVAIGLAAAAFLGDYIEHLVFGVQAVEPSVYLAVAILFSITAVAATYGPARDAATTDPKHVLRQD